MQTKAKRNPPATLAPSQGSSKSGGGAGCIAGYYHAPKFFSPVEDVVRWGIISRAFQHSDPRAHGGIYDLASTSISLAGGPIAVGMYGLAAHQREAFRYAYPVLYGLVCDRDAVLSVWYVPPLPSIDRPWDRAEPSPAIPSGEAREAVERGGSAERGAGTENLDAPRGQKRRHAEVEDPREGVQVTETGRTDQGREGQASPVVPPANTYPEATQAIRDRVMTAGGVRASVAWQSHSSPAQGPQSQATSTAPTTNDGGGRGSWNWTPRQRFGTVDVPRGATSFPILWDDPRFAGDHRAELSFTHEADAGGSPFVALNWVARCGTGAGIGTGTGTGTGGSSRAETVRVLMLFKKRRGFVVDAQTTEDERRRLGIGADANAVRAHFNAQLMRWGPVLSDATPQRRASVVVGAVGGAASRRDAGGVGSGGVNEVVETSK